MTLSEGRLSFLAHELLRCSLAGKLGRVRNERLFLLEAKKLLEEAFSVDSQADRLARARIPPRIPHGSREWDVLYRKAYEEERRKLAGR